MDAQLLAGTVALLSSAVSASRTRRWRSPHSRRSGGAMQLKPCYSSSGRVIACRTSTAPSGDDQLFYRWVASSTSAPIGSTLRQYCASEFRERRRFTRSPAVTTKKEIPAATRRDPASEAGFRQGRGAGV